MDDLTVLYKKICSSETLYSHRRGFFFEFSEISKELFGLPQISSIFGKSYLDEERMRKLLKDESINSIASRILNNISTLYEEKNALSSKKKRLESIISRKNENIAVIIQQLNDAVLKAPELGNCTQIDDGLSLPLALIVRADILLEHQAYSSAYEDLKNLSKLSIQILHKKKIFQKMLLCRSIENAREEINCNSPISNKMKDIFLGSVSNISSISNLVDVRQSDFAGKEAIAKCIINPGDVLLVENPLASCLLFKYYKSHCQTCLKRFKICYGCPKCSAVGFCSYKCRDIALTSYHYYECNISYLLLGSGMSILSYLALRIVTVLGLQKCMSIYNSLSSSSVEKFDTDFKNLLEIYTLENHSNRRESIEFFERSLMAEFLVQCLKQTNFFKDKVKELSFTGCKLNAEIIVGSLILKHLQFLQFNTHEIFENDSNISISPSSRKAALKYIGAGIYPKAARFNHQCYSATIRYFSGNKIVLRSSRLLQVNDVIAENYGVHFINKDLAERKRYLCGRYWFDCRCLACYSNWPTLNKIQHNSIRIRCKNAHCKENIDIPIYRSYKCIHLCNHCKTSFYLSKKHQNILKTCILWYAYGISIMNKKLVFEAAQVLLTALRTFHHIAYPPHRFTHIAEMGLQQCLMCSN